MAELQAKLVPLVFVWVAVSVGLGSLCRLDDWPAGLGRKDEAGIGDYLFHVAGGAPRGGMFRLTRAALFGVGGGLGAFKATEVYNDLMNPQIDASASQITDLDLIDKATMSPRLILIPTGPVADGSE